MKLIKKLLVLPTMQCNLNCTYCFEKETRDALCSLETNKDNILETFNTIVDNIGLELNSTLEFTGGEALLRQDIMIEVYDRYMEELDKRNYTGKLSLLTNGVIFPEKFINHISEDMLINMSIQISMDVPLGYGSKRMNNKTKLLVIENIKKYSELVDNVSVRSTIDADSVNTLYEMYKFVTEDLEVRHTYGFDFLSDIDLTIYEDQLNLITDLKISKGITRNLSTNKVNKCACGNTLITITPDGGIAPCPRWLSNHKVPKYGDIKSMEFEDMDTRYTKSEYINKYCIGGNCGNECLVCSQENLAITGSTSKSPKLKCKIKHIDTIVNSRLK